MHLVGPRRRGAYHFARCRARFVDVLIGDFGRQRPDIAQGVHISNTAAVKELGAANGQMSRMMLVMWKYFSFSRLMMHFAGQVMQQPLTNFCE